MNVSYPDLFGPLSDSEYLRQAAVDCGNDAWGDHRSLVAQNDAENYVSNVVAIVGPFCPFRWLQILS